MPEMTDNDCHSASTMYITVQETVTVHPNQASMISASGAAMPTDEATTSSYEPLTTTTIKTRTSTKYLTEITTIESASATAADTFSYIPSTSNITSVFGASSTVLVSGAAINSANATAVAVTPASNGSATAITLAPTVPTTTAAEPAYSILTLGSAGNRASSDVNFMALFILFVGWLFV